MQQTDALKNRNRKYHSPGERAARFILGVTGFIRDIFTSPARVVPRGRALQHQGQLLPVGKELRYANILIVEDNPDTAEKFSETIRNYYVYGTVGIFTAHDFEAARTFFANEDIDLVIMDVDLDDDNGNGEMLTREFRHERPDLVILANSSRKISNMKLMGLGALETLGKKTEKLMNWLLLNDPAGSRG